MLKRVSENYLSASSKYVQGSMIDRESLASGAACDHHFVYQHNLAHASICSFDRCSSFCVGGYLAAGVNYVVLEGDNTREGTAEIIFDCEARTSCLII